jgi:hypothetical protein
MKASFNPEPYADQRSSPRRKALLTAKVVDRESAQSIDCTIRDISDGGAGIEFAADQIVPNQVFLIDMRSGNAHKAEVRWRKPRRAGLRFLQTISLRESVPEDVQHLKRLWESGSARPAPDTVKVTPDMTSAGVAALAAWRLDNIPALASEQEMVRAVFIAMYGTMAK